MPRGPSSRSKKVRRPARYSSSWPETSSNPRSDLGPKIQACQLIVVTHDHKVTKPRGENRVLGRHRAGLGQHRLLPQSCLLYLEDAQNYGFVRSPDHRAPSGRIDHR